MNIFNKKKQFPAVNDIVHKKAERIFFDKTCCPSLILTTTEYKVIEITTQVNEIVFEGEAILKLKSFLSEINYVKMPYEGQIRSINVASGDEIRVGHLLFEILKPTDIENYTEKATEARRRKLHKTSISCLIDDFTKKKSISFNEIAGVKTSTLDLVSRTTEILGLAFENNNGFAYLRVLSISEDLALAKGDQIIFLFCDDSTLDYSFQQKATGDKWMHSNHLPLSYEYHKKFASSNLKKVKLTSERKGLFNIYSFDKTDKTKTYNTQYRTEEEGQYLLRYMLAMYLKACIDNGLLKE